MRTLTACRDAKPLGFVVDDTAPSSTSPRPRPSSTSSATGTVAHRPHRLSWDGSHGAPSAFVRSRRRIRPPAPRTHSRTTDTSARPARADVCGLASRSSSAHSRAGTTELAAVSGARVFVRPVRGVGAPTAVRGRATVATLGGQLSATSFTVSRRAGVASTLFGEGGCLDGARCALSSVMYFPLARS